MKQKTGHRSSDRSHHTRRDQRNRPDPRCEITFEKTACPILVPGRNLLFFTYAAAVGYRRDIENLVGGMCETDYSGYPDCREKTLQALQTAITLGTDKNFIIHTPLMQLTKAATWELVQKLGGDALVNLIISETHTCYLGERGQRHDWGFGCDACRLAHCGRMAGTSGALALKPPDKSSACNEKIVERSQHLLINHTKMSRDHFIVSLRRRNRVNRQHG